MRTFRHSQPLFRQNMVYADSTSRRFFVTLPIKRHVITNKNRNDYEETKSQIIPGTNGNAALCCLISPPVDVGTKQCLYHYNIRKHH